jgi:hypothetical protein
VTSNDSWRRYLEAGTALGQVTLGRAEEIAKGLLAPGDEEREAGRNDLDELTRFGRQMGEQFVDMARAEVSKQLEALGVDSLEELFDRLADLVRSQPVDVPSHRAESAPDPGPPEHLEPVDGAGGTGESKPEQNKPEQKQKQKAVKNTKAENTKAEKTKAEKKDAKGAGSERQADKLHKKLKKPEKHTKGEKLNKNNNKNKMEKDPPSRPAAGPNRVLTLARPPDSTGRV